LSPEWIAEIDRALRDAAHPLRGEGEPIVIEQIVTGAPDGDVRFHVVLEADDAFARRGAAPEAHLRITVDFPTALALLRGETNAQHALASGRMKLHGDLDVLARRAGDLASVTDMLASVRATTTIP
jgi:alkyl sulfatase BDS1-like metallo-beta-lactamase superfamily hydrolase